MTHDSKIEIQSRGTTYTVHVYLNDAGFPSVQIDTPDEPSAIDPTTAGQEPLIRVFLNEATLYRPPSERGQEDLEDFTLPSGAVVMLSQGEPVTVDLNGTTELLVVKEIREILGLRVDLKRLDDPHATDIFAVMGFTRL